MAHKVKIAARLRPRLPAEVDDEGIQVVRSADGASSTISVRNPRDVSQIFHFPFTSCYDENSTQEEIYTRDVEPMIDIVYSGVTVTIFAYGVTSSGKTHTMQGTPEQPGVIPRVVRGLFEHRARLAQHGIEFGVSYMEIYKDEVYDLLVNRDNAPKLPVRENDVGKVFVANLSVLPISSAEEFEALYSRANKQRSVGSTLLNRASSRSHAIVTIEVSGLPCETEGKTLTGKINLVDLAGSENNKLTGNDPSRMAESAAINKSLSVLGQVVHALNQGATRIPYRNAKLTRILQDALGGSSVGLLMCNLAPGNKFRQDTLNTLNFAVRTKNVENKPVINERDNRPAPKPHFAAVAQRAAKPPPAVFPTGPLPPIPGSPSASGSSGSPPMAAPIAHVPHINFGAGRQSLAPAAMGMGGGENTRRPSRVPRMSVAGLAALGGGLGLGFAGAAVAGSSRAPSRSSSALTEEEMDERIRKIVEREVAKRMEGVREQEREAALITARAEAQAEAELERRRERERERERSLERLRELERSQILEETLPQFEEADEWVAEQPSGGADGAEEEPHLPPGVLTPLLKRHADLDSELMKRLEDLEKKYERGDKEVRMADVLSPVSRKKTGRAYVALARAHTEKGDLQVALDFYRKAEKYVPDNAKLKERILEIEWCVKEGKGFNPSPKKPKKAKSSKVARVPSKKRSSRPRTQAAGADTNAVQAADQTARAAGTDDEQMEVEQLVSAAGEGKTRVSKKKADGADAFGTEVTNGRGPPGSLSPGKRHAEELDDVVGEGEGESASAAGAPPRRKRRSAARKVIVEIEDSDEDEDVQFASAPRRSKRKVAAR